MKIIIRKTTTDGLARHLSRNRESARKNPLTLARDREDLEHIRALLAAVPVMPPNSPPRVRSARAKSAQLEAALYGFDEEAKKSSARKPSPSLPAASASAAAASLGVARPTLASRLAVSTSTAESSSPLQSRSSRRRRVDLVLEVSGV